MSRIVHFEIPADDTGRAREFWGGLFGYEFQSMDGPVEYHMFQTGENQGGAVTTSHGDKGLVTYFLVDDVDAARQKIEELGGSADDKQPVPGMGWSAHAKDTEGNSFSLWQSDESAG
jgi:predicted enzyme related to lactoylglutathione lyase